MTRDDGGMRDTVSPGSVGTPTLVFGRVVSVTGAKCVAQLVNPHGVTDAASTAPRAQMGTLVAIDAPSSTVLAVVVAMFARDAEQTGWNAELGLVGEIRKGHGRVRFARGVANYPCLGDSVRVADSSELTLAFGSTAQGAVRIGSILQDPSIAVFVGVDELLGKHFAVLGTTGTGKSCTTALILRSVLQQNPAAHMILLDPHNEYATAFKDCAEVVNQHNMQLPYWLLTFEELVEVVLGDRPDRRQEIEILQDLIPIAKARYGRGPVPHGLRRATDLKYSVDTPVPYRLSELISMLDERMGRLENKRDLSPYRNLKIRLESISQDPRYDFMFGSLTVFDGMAEILGRLFRVPTNGRPITIVELAGLPAEVTTVVVSLLSRLTFDFALWCEGQVPVTLVCEEAHRYVPAAADGAFEPCRRAIAKIAKEGRKYGASLCIVTQRPAEIDPTILSQCNTVISHRLSNDRDQELVRFAISETGSGLLGFLSTLGPREAIAFGDGVSLPVRMRLDELSAQHLPRCGSARFSELWQVSNGDAPFLESVVQRWRNAATREFDEEAESAPAAETEVPESPVKSRVEMPAPSYEPGIERREFGAIRRPGRLLAGNAIPDGHGPAGMVPTLRRRHTDP